MDLVLLLTTLTALTTDAQNNALINNLSMLSLVSSQIATECCQFTFSSVYNSDIFRNGQECAGKDRTEVTLI
jgi:hypothetical protein